MTDDKFRLALACIFLSSQSHLRGGNKILLTNLSFAKKDGPKDESHSHWRHQVARHTGSGSCSGSHGCPAARKVQFPAEMWEGFRNLILMILLSIREAKWLGLGIRFAADVGFPENVEINPISKTFLCCRRCRRRCRPEKYSIIRIFYVWMWQNATQQLRKFFLHLLNLAMSWR